MKSIKVIVPRLMIKHHLPHPEFYGESLVELLNGMVTDVFTSEKGDLFTETNDKTLIQYLKNNNVEDPRFVLSQDTINLRSVTSYDVELVLGWMNELTAYSYNEIQYREEDVQIYVSHAITSCSHLLIIENNGAPSGLVGYDVIDGIGIIDVKIYEKDSVIDEDVDLALRLLLNHITNNHNVSNFSTLVFNDDTYTQQLLIRNKFVIEPNKVIELPVSENDTKEAVVYQYENFGMILSETEKQILNNFLQTYPDKLYEYANPDQFIDLEHAIDYKMKSYVKLILTRQIKKIYELEDSESDDVEIEIEDNIIEKYEEMMALLKGRDLEIATQYKELMYKVLLIINKYKKMCLDLNLYTLN